MYYTMTCLVAAALYLPLVSALHVPPGALTPPHPQADCSATTVGECDPNRDELIGVSSLPDGPTAVAACQLKCAEREGCQYFTYNRQLATCALYHYRYLESCQLIGGTAWPPMDKCHHEVEQGDTCSSYMRQDCAYSQVVFNSTVTDAHSCQELLVVLGDAYQAEYFVYNRLDLLCTFYASVEMTCAAVSGPLGGPSVEECGIETSPTPTEEQTTTVEMTTIEEETTVDEQTTVEEETTVGEQTTA